MLNSPAFSILNFKGLCFLLFSLVCTYTEAQITVTNTNDLGAGSLRDAVTQANANIGADNIIFDAALSGSTITLFSEITITSGNGDGTTISGDIDGNGTIDISIVSDDGTGTGLIIQASNCQVSYLNLQGFGGAGNAAIEIDGINGGGSNTILSNYIGTSLDGSVAGTSNFRGVAIVGGSSLNTIGNGTALGKNVISSNSFGIYINGANNNTISGNIVGLNAIGNVAVPNLGSGIEVINSTSINIGISGAEKNIISGNGNEGIALSSSSSATILNNYIGLDLNGTTAIGNSWDGINLDATSTASIGNSTADGRNVICANGQEGIDISSGGNTIMGNFIGLDRGGGGEGNTGAGIWIRTGALGNRIGDGTADGRNAIGSNGSHGILVADGPNEIYGNHIGLTNNGTGRRGNATFGISVTGGVGTQIGNSIAGYGNVISENSTGINISASGSAIILGNIIGMNSNGNAERANDNEGIRLTGNASSIIIGDGTSLGANIISGNVGNGILLSGVNVTNNTINGNFIGLEGDFTTGLPNGGNGILIENDANSNGITNNTIAFNTLNGIEVDGFGTTSTQNNRISQNSIFSNTQKGINVINGAQASVTAPTITNIDASGLITGTSSGNETIELFFDLEDEGKFFHDVTTAFGGVWSYTINITDLPGGVDKVTATAIDINNTSEFSNAFAVPFNLFEVINTDDSGAGSLRWAIENSNGIPGANTITFNIPIGDPGHTNGVWTIEPATMLPQILEEVVIDGTSQPGAESYRIIIDGAGTLNTGLDANAKVDIYGLFVKGFTSGLNAAGITLRNGADNSVIGNGSGGGNIVSLNSRGIYINGPSNVIVKGNLVGLDENNLAAPNVQGIYQNGSSVNCLIGGSLSGEGNIVSGNSGSGVWLANGAHTVEGNYIGTDPSGMSSIPNNTGIDLRSNSNSTTILNNIISGNDSWGILIYSNSNIIQTNLIGVGEDGITPIPNGTGIHAEGGVFDNLIGGITPGEGNIIAHNNLQGVFMDRDTQDRNQIIGNSIYSNGYYGIDLNLANPPDLGNDGKAAPTIDNVINGAVSGTGVDDDIIHVYRDNSGSIPLQGQEYLGLTTVSSGVWNFNDGSILSTDNINATATDVSGNTSQFAINYPSDWFTVVNTNDSGPGSLREAIIRANFVDGPNTIDFNIPISDSNYENTGLGDRWTINLLTALPGISTELTIDATTQPGNGSYRIKIDGQDRSFNGFSSSSISFTVYGMYLTRFDRGFYVNFPGRNLTVGADNKGNVINDCSRAITLLTSSGHVIKGNYIGVDETGEIAVPNNGGIGMTNVSNFVIGGSLPGERNIISGNTGQGVALNLGGNNVLENNYIGTNKTGDIAIPNGTGVNIRGEVSVLNNIISGNTGIGLTYNYTNAGAVFGNRIGVDINDNPMPNEIGISVLTNSTLENVVIGGTGAGEANIIAHNIQDGIFFKQAGHQFLPIIGNSIYCNGGLGIDLNGAANGNKQPPVITSFDASSVSGTGIDGDIIHVYRDNSGCTPLQGQEYLGPTTVAGGVWSLSGLTLDPATDYINATATDASNNTSPFALDYGEIAVFEGMDNTGTEIIDGQVAVINMGLGVLNQNKQYSITIENNTVVDLAISDITTSNPEFTIVSSPSKISRNSSETFQINVNATTPGTFTETITIVNDDQDEGNFTFDVTIRIAEGFVSVWQTDNPGTSTNTQISLPKIPETYLYDVYWEEVGNISNSGSIIGFNDAPHTIDFLSAGTYLVEIVGTFPVMQFNNAGDAQKLLSIEHWGNIVWNRMDYAFAGCSNLVINATDAPILSGVNSLEGMFQNASSLNADLSGWDVGTVTNMASMFDGASLFNQDVGTWDVDQVTDMSNMFLNATSFNNGGTPLIWTTTALTSISQMFSGASQFNQDLPNFDLSGVSIFTGVFQNASAFNQDLSAWDVSGASQMDFMFDGANAFNQSLATWDVSGVSDMTSMLDNTALSKDNYDASLIGWNALPVLLPDVIMGAAGLNYCLATPDRQNIISTYNWTINDAGAICPELELYEGIDNTGTLITNGQVSPVDFGSTLQGSDAILTFTLENTGVDNLNITSLSVSGSVFTSTLTVPTTITSANTINFDIAMSGATVGNFNETVTIQSDDLDESTFTFDIIGVVQSEQELNITDGATTLISPASIDLGSAVIGSDITRSLTITNTGDVDLIISGYSFTTGTDFSTTSTPGTVTAGSTTTVDIVLSGASIGSFFDQLAITSNDTDESTFLVNLSGSITAAPEPEIAVSQNSTPLISTDNLDFGTTLQGTDVTLALDISNLGTADLTITSISFTGSEFSSAASAITIAPGSSSSIDVTLDATSLGSFSSSLTINNNDADEGTFTLNLTGVVDPIPVPELEITYNSNVLSDNTIINFDNVIEGNTKTLSLSIENLGTADLVINSAAFTTGTEFSTVAVFPLTIAAGASTNLDITFSGTNAGTFSDQVTLSSNDSDESTQAFTLTGVVLTEQEINLLDGGNTLVSGSDIDMGSGFVNTELTKIITVENTGDLDLVLTDFSFSSGVEFTSDATGTTLAAGATLDLTITLNSSTAGSFNDVLTISTNDSDEGTFVINLTGTLNSIPVPSIEISNGGTVLNSLETLDLGSSLLGTEITTSLLVTNNGDADLTISAVQLADGSSYSIGTLSLPIILAPTATQSVDLTLITGAAGDFTDVLTVTSDDPENGVFEINLSGTINPIPVPDITVLSEGIELANNSTIEFGSQLQGASISRSLEVRNDGNENLSLTDIQSSVSVFNPQFDQSVTLTPGETFPVEILLGTASVGAFEGTVTITSDDPDEGSYILNLTASLEGARVVVVITNPDNSVDRIIIENQDVDVGSTPLSENINKLFGVENIGGQEITIQSITVDNPVFRVLDFEPVVPADGVIEFTIELLATDVGTHRGTVRVITNRSTLSFSIVGEVLELADPPIVVYNVVTPNGDGIHDYFKIESIPYYPDNVVTIYNRWGNKVYEIQGYDNIDNVFIGTSNVGGTKELDTGNYYYIITPGGNHEPLKGFLHLRR